MIWCAVNTKPQKEDYAAKQLALKNIEIFLPKIEVTRKRGGQRQTLPEPLFPGYLFVRVSTSPDVVGKVNWTPGVRRLLCTGETPVPVPDEAINLIQQRLALAGADAPAPGQSLLPGTRVAVRNGPLAGLLGVVDKPASGRGRVKVLLQFLQQETPVICNAIDLDIVKPARAG